MARGGSMKQRGSLAVLVFALLGSGCTVDEYPPGSSARQPAPVP